MGPRRTRDHCLVQGLGGQEHYHRLPLYRGDTTIFRRFSSSLLALAQVGRVGVNSELSKISRCSSANRFIARHAGGRRFKSCIAHFDVGLSAVARESFPLTSTMLRQPDQPRPNEGRGCSFCQRLSRLSSRCHGISVTGSATAIGRKRRCPSLGLADVPRWPRVERQGRQGVECPMQSRSFGSV